MKWRSWGLGGTFDLESTHGKWNDIGSRANVFTGMPSAVYLPIQTSFAVKAVRDCDLAFCYCRAEESFPAALIQPSDVRVEIREARTRLARSITSSPPNSLSTAPDRGGLHARAVTGPAILPTSTMCTTRPGK